MAVLLFTRLISLGQGRVVVNEFMPWAGCSTTSEFIELLNFGPGPMNIGCYIVTNGTYSVTIPPNTIIQPGEYFVLAGQNVLNAGCGNIDSAVTVDLNWSTCNCTNVPIPTTGSGFMQNGGSANEKIVLLDPSLKVLDAVTRSSPPSSSFTIMTPSLGGACTPKTFNLSAMSIAYEAMNVSSGIDNSFARKVDGDCGWVKTTDISAGAPNKTESTSSAAYSFTTLSASQCSGSTGSISIAVNATNVAALFPMTYTLAHDVDSNNIFNETDTYQYGTDSSASSIDINNLAYGRYKITVGSASGCNLQSFSFFIFNCYGVVLPYKIASFNYTGKKNGRKHFEAIVNGANNIESLVLEGGEGNAYQPLETINNTDKEVRDNKPVKFSIPADASYKNYRLKLIDGDDVISYSRELHVTETSSADLWPNPCKEKLYIKMMSSSTRQSAYIIYNETGRTVSRKPVLLKQGLNVIQVETSSLKKGMYYVAIASDTPSFERFYRE